MRKISTTKHHFTYKVKAGHFFQYFPRNMWQATFLDIIIHYCIYKFNNAKSGSKDSTRRNALLNLKLFFFVPCDKPIISTTARYKKPATHPLSLIHEVFSICWRLETLKLNEFLYCCRYFVCLFYSNDGCWLVTKSVSQSWSSACNRADLCLQFPLRPEYGVGFSISYRMRR